jgi:hypothetical protein
MTTTKNPKIYSYQLRVRSLDPAQPVANVVAQIRDLSPQMAGELKEYGNDLKVSVKREKAIPVDPVTIIVLVELANLTLKPLVEGFFHKLGEKMAGFLTGEVDNAQISVEKEPNLANDEKRDTKTSPPTNKKKKKNKK